MFGRINPPTLGHKLLFNTLKQTANGSDYFIFLSQKQDAVKNPLTFEEKVYFISEMYPDYADHIVKDFAPSNIMAVAEWLYKKGYSDVVFVAGADRLNDFATLLTTYNGVEGKNHYYKFGSINFKSSGDRDDNSEDISGVSASKARQAVKDNNYADFVAVVGNTSVTKELFETLKKAMWLSESTEETPINKARRLDRMLDQIEYLKKKTTKSKGSSFKTTPDVLNSLEKDLNKLKRTVKEEDISEDASGGGCSAGAIASVALPFKKPKKKK